MKVRIPQLHYKDVAIDTLQYHGEDVLAEINGGTAAQRAALFVRDLAPLTAPITRTERVLLFVLATYQGGEQGWPSARRLAKQVGVSQRHLYRLTGKLERHKVLVIYRRTTVAGARDTNVYRFTALLED